MQFLQTVNDALCLQVTESSHQPFQVRDTRMGVLPIIICCSARACVSVADVEVAEDIVYVILFSMSGVQVTASPAA